MPRRRKKYRRRGGTQPPVEVREIGPDDEVPSGVATRRTPRPTLAQREAVTKARIEAGETYRSQRGSTYKRKVKRR